MFTNLQIPFDFSKFEKRKPPMQKAFEKANRELLLKFRSYVIDAHEKVHSLFFSVFAPSEMDRNMPAVAMISFLRKSLIRDFPFYCRAATNGRFKLVTPDNEYIYIKKLDEKLRPSNIETISNNLILNQLTADKKDKGPNIFLGYTTPGAGKYSHITGVYAVCIDGNREVWRTDINSLNNNNQSPLVSIRPKGGDPKLKDGVVKIRKAKRE